jgi:molybdopterin converting factor small subunit
MLKDAIGRDAVIVLDGGSTVGDLINKLDEEYGATYREKMGETLKDSIMKRFNLLVGGKVLVPSRDIATPLKDGDEVLLFQFVGGG